MAPGNCEMDAICCNSMQTLGNKTGFVSFPGLNEWAQGRIGSEGGSRDGVCPCWDAWGDTIPLKDEISY